jgi:hypothetical protein
MMRKVIQIAVVAAPEPGSDDGTIWQTYRDCRAGAEKWSQIQSIPDGPGIPDEPDKMGAINIIFDGPPSHESGR